MDPKFWQDSDADLLRSAMLRRGLDLFQLAKLTALSSQQIAELLGRPVPSRQKSCFYSDTIKYHAGQSLLGLLLGPQSTCALLPPRQQQKDMAQGE